MVRTNIPAFQLFIFCFLVSGLFFTTVSCRENTPRLAIPQLVKTSDVKEHKGMSSVSYPGTLQAASDVKLAFRVAGPVKAFYAKEGGFVKKGALLAEIDPRDYQLQYDATSAEYQQVKGESQRVAELYRRGSVPVNEYDKAVAALKRVTALYNAHKNALQDTRLKAPFDGYIQKKYFDTYEIVNQGVPVLSMIDNNYFEVDIDIPSSDYIRRADFVSFQCAADVYPDTLLPLELLDVNQKANANQLFKVRFLLKKDKALKLAAGMSANVTINYTPSSGGLAVVPVSALFQQKGASFVWLYDDSQGTIKRVPVAVQQVLKDGLAVVKADLRQGQSVVSAGVNTLRDGQQVKRLPSVPASNVGGLL